MAEVEGNEEWNSFSDMDREYVLDSIPDPTTIEKKWSNHNTSLDRAQEKKKFKSSPGSVVTPLEKKVLRQLARFGRPVSPKEIAGPLGYSTGDRVQLSLKKLLALGVIERVAPGLYVTK